MVYTVKENVPRHNIPHVTPASDLDNVENGPNTAGEPTRKRKSWKYYFWDSFDKSKEEQRLILKLDLTLMTFGCLGTFIKYIDRSNLNSAFVSGMEEDLSLYGNVSLGIFQALFKPHLRDVRITAHKILNNCSNLTTPTLVTLSPTSLLSGLPTCFLLV